MQVLTLEVSGDRTVPTVLSFFAGVVIGIILVLIFLYIRYRIKIIRKVKLS